MECLQIEDLNILINVIKFGQGFHKRLVILGAQLEMF